MSERTAELAKKRYEVAFRRLFYRYLFTAFAAFLVGGVLGILIRVNQSTPFLNPSLHYSFMTFHGFSMNAFIVVALIGIGWFVIVKILNLPKPLKRIELVYWLLLAGFASVAIAVFAGRFATGFPPMPPLPVVMAGGWPRWATGFFLSGMILVFIGAIAFFIEWLIAAHQATGGIGEALGLDVFRKKSDPHAPGTKTTLPIIPLTAMSLVGVMALPIGLYLFLNIFTRLLNSNFLFDPLMAKNALWMSAHTLVNILFWGAFSIVYLLIPAYTGREWRVYPILVAGWLTTIVTTGLTAFLHHVQMDFAIPFQLLLIGQIATYLSVIPWAGVSVWGALSRVWRSGTRWTPSLSFVYLGLFGFMIGGTAAFLDTTIGFNRVLHNTLWVPAHFHSYMMMGSVLFIFAAIYHVLPGLTGKLVSVRLSSAHLWLTLTGGIGTLGTFYLAGLLNAPRRFAAFPFSQLPAGLDVVLIISIPFIVAFAAGQLVFVYNVLRTVFSRAK